MAHGQAKAQQRGLLAPPQCEIKAEADALQLAEGDIAKARACDMLRGKLRQMINTLQRLPISSSNAGTALVATAEEVACRPFFRTMCVAYVSHMPATFSPHWHGSRQCPEGAPVGQAGQQRHEVCLPMLLPALSHVATLLGHDVTDGQRVCGPGVRRHLHPGLLQGRQNLHGKTDVSSPHANPFRSAFRVLRKLRSGMRY